MNRTISIVVPAFNEEKIIGNFIDDLTDFLKRGNINYDLVIVENGSVDKTLEISQEKGKKDARIKIFHLPHPAYGQALKLGFKKATGDFVIVFNVDFWESKFIDMAEKNDFPADIIVASKNLPLSKDERSLMRKIITRSFVFFLRVFLGFKGTDTHGIKIFRKKVLQEILPKCKIQNDLFDSELLIRAQRSGFKIIELPIEVKEIRPARFKGRIFGTPKDLIELFWSLR